MQIINSKPTKRHWRIIYIFHPTPPSKFSNCFHSTPMTIVSYKIVLMNHHVIKSQNVKHTRLAKTFTVLQRRTMSIFHLLCMGIYSLNRKHEHNQGSSLNFVPLWNSAISRSLKQQQLYTKWPGRWHNERRVSTTLLFLYCHGGVGFISIVYITLYVGI